MAWIRTQSYGYFNQFYFSHRDLYNPLGTLDP